MKILDRYILKKFLSTFAFVVVILIAIILIITFSERNELFIHNNVSRRLILRYFLCLAPHIANMLTPITIFIATVFVTSKLAVHTEFIAFLSGGVSYPRMLRPFLIGAIIIATITFVGTGWIIPEGNKFRVYFEARYFDGIPDFSERDVHFKVSPTQDVYFSSYDSQKDIGYSFTLEEIERRDIKWKLSARDATWDSTALGWRLQEWHLRVFDSLKEQYTYQNTRDTLIKINMTPADFNNTKNFEQTLTITELNDYIADLKMKGADNILIYQVEKLARYMSPFTAIILTFIGVILSSRKTRGGVSFQVALGFMLAFIYILLFMAAKSNAETGSMNPVLAIWLPNFVFSILGALLYRFVPK